MLEQKARRVAVFTAASLRGQGLGLVPRGKEPHFDASVGEIYETLFADVQAAMASAAELVDRFMAASYTVEVNPSYEQDPS